MRDRQARKRSSSVTSDWTMPEWVFRRSPADVTIVRWIAERVFDTCSNAPSLVLSWVRYGFSIEKGRDENFISQTLITWSALSINMSIWAPAG